MIRHLIPRAEWGGWSGGGLTVDPTGGEEMPQGFARSMRIALGETTITPLRDQIKGGIVTVQWFGLMIEIAVGRVR